MKWKQFLSSVCVCCCVYVRTYENNDLVMEKNNNEQTCHIETVKKHISIPYSLKHKAEHHVDLLEWAIVTFYFHHSTTWNRVDFNLYFTCQNMKKKIIILESCDILHVCFHNDDYKLSQIYPNRYVNILVKWSCCVTMKTNPKKIVIYISCTMITKKGFLKMLLRCLVFSEGMDGLVIVYGWWLWSLNCVFFVNSIFADFTKFISSTQSSELFILENFHLILTTVTWWLEHRAIVHDVNSSILRTSNYFQNI